MATFKTTNSDYVIKTTKTGSNVTIQSDEIYLLGNLTISGKSQTVVSNEVLISDNIIVLNAAWPSNVAPILDAGFTINRGASANVEILWNETSNKWTLTNDGSTYQDIATGTLTGLAAVINDATPSLGGNLNVNQYTITSNVGNIKFEGNIQLRNTAVIPSLVANSTVLYANTPGSAGSGLYVQNSMSTDQELVTRAKAIAFSIIL